ncbi:ABC transporter permease [Kitasatospora nipponensis]|uniref:ABC transporter permease n=1 Tax=Kitasatospora nipponensis TaxID=258049 RepID=A0ABN1WLS4_9ACTN
MGRFVLRRVRSRLALAAAALLTVVLTAAVLTTLAAFDGQVGDAGVRSALATRDRPHTTLLVSGEVQPADLPAAEERVRAVDRAVFAPLPSTERELISSHTFALPGSPTPAPAGGTPRPDLTVLATVSPDLCTLTGGRWPAPAGPAGPPQAAVPDAALARLGLRPEALPATVRLIDRFTDQPLDVTVTGSYHASDPTAAYWQLDPLAGRGRQGSGFTTYGPLLVDPSAFTAGALPAGTTRWLVEADFGRLSGGALADLAERARTRPGALVNGAGLVATTDLPATLDQLRTALLVTRSTLVIGVLQLVVLAGAGLLLLARLLTERQEVENALLAARGAAPGRIARLTAAETLLLTLPAALLAPPLTPPLLRLIAGHGPLARSGVRLDTTVSGGDWPVALLVALAAALTVLAPTVLRGGAARALHRAGLLHALVSGLARSGADLALLALAVLGYLQLSRYSAQGAGGALSTDAAGRLGVDPVLVTAPTLGLCAGTLLVLRVLPLLGRIGERWAARGRGLDAALVGWQFARRPARNSGPVLLLVLALATGTLALAQSSSWTASQRDQAAYATAGGLRITGTGVPALGQGGMLAAGPGGERLIPVEREQLALSSGGATLLALDTRRAAQWLRPGPQLTGGRSAAQLFGALAAPAPQGPRAGLPLPGRPVRIALDVTVDSGPLRPPPADLGLPTTDPADGLRQPVVLLRLRDGFGVLHTIPLGSLPDGDSTAVADLDTLAGAPQGAIAYPLTVAGFEVDYQESTAGTRAQRLVVHRLAVRDATELPGGADTAVAAPADLGWSAVSVPPSDVPKGHPGDFPPRTDATVERGPNGGLPAIHYETGYGQSGTTVLLSPADAATGTPATAPTILNVVATRDYLDAVHGKVGSVLPLGTGDSALQARIVAVVPALPTLTDSTGTRSVGLVVDLATLERARVDRQLPPIQPSEWWLPGTGPGDPVPARAAQALRASQLPAQLQVQQEVAAALRRDPLGAAPQSALLALAMAAAVLAAIGFAAGAVGAAGEPAAEFAVLRALGTPHRQLARTAAAEQGLLIALGVGIGALLGTALVHLVVPLTVLTPAAQRPIPGVRVELPLWQVLVLLVAVAALPALLTVHRVLRPARAAETVSRLRHTEEM